MPFEAIICKTGRAQKNVTRSENWSCCVQARTRPPSFQDKGGTVLLVQVQAVYVLVRREHLSFRITIKLKHILNLKRILPFGTTTMCRWFEQPFPLWSSFQPGNSEYEPSPLMPDWTTSFTCVLMHSEEFLMESFQGPSFRSWLGPDQQVERRVQCKTSADAWGKTVHTPSHGWASPKHASPLITLLAKTFLRSVFPCCPPIFIGWVSSVPYLVIFID